MTLEFKSNSMNVSNYKHDVANKENRNGEHNSNNSRIKLQNKQAVHNKTTHTTYDWFNQYAVKQSTTKTTNNNKHERRHKKVNSGSASD